MDNYDIIIIGGGAAGCMAAITASRLSSKAAAPQYPKILIIEKNDKLLKKIYATGNGKCNFTNEIQSVACYRSAHPQKAYTIIDRFDKDRTISFFKELGILPKNKNGYYYPYSEQASTVAEGFIIEVKRCGIMIVYNTSVSKIIKNKGKKDAVAFTIQTNHSSYYGHKVIIAAGGAASPSHGSDGSGYKLIEELGHKLIKPLPALTQLKGEGRYFKGIAGVRVEGVGDLYIEDKKSATEQGEYLFTEYGISGIPVLQMSRFASRALDAGKQVYLSLDLFPDYHIDEFIKLLIDKYDAERHKTIEEVLRGMTNKKLAYAILKELKINPELAAKAMFDNNLSETKSTTNYKAVPKAMQYGNIIMLAKVLKGFRMNIIGTNGFDKAQTSSGGVSFMEINEKTMESMIEPGIYLAGEIIDVDGTCGGYNLQWAFSSGYVAGAAAINASKDWTQYD